MGAKIKKIRQGLLDYYRVPPPIHVEPAAAPAVEMVAPDADIHHMQDEEFNDFEGEVKQDLWMKSWRVAMMATFLTCLIFYM